MDGSGLYEVAVGRVCHIASVDHYLCQLALKVEKVALVLGTSWQS